MLPELFSREFSQEIMSIEMYQSDMLSFRSIVGRPRHEGVMLGLTQKDSYIGWVLVIHYRPKAN